MEGRGCVLCLLVGVLLVSVAEALQCRAVPGSLKQVDAGAGRVCGVDNADNLVSYQGNSWVSLAMKGKHVSVGPAGLWSVSLASLVFKWLRGRWIQVQPGSLIQIDAGGDKFVVGVNAANSIFCLNSGPVLQYAGQGNIPWIPVVGSLKYYSCGPFGCWGVNRLDRIFVKLDVSGDSCKGSDRWYPIQGSLSLVEVGSDGSVYGVSRNGVVFKRLGVDACNPFGRRWWALRAAGVARHVSYDRGILWIVCKDGRVQRCQV
ncbi:fish-egg lectin-like [Lepisosteus oculatus]|uniref:fish-egg lectin-like n=1 Tax=Lepisosteus oculatus TaxID=7918 RepID=UPI00371E2EC5